MEAFELGFTTGKREDYKLFEGGKPPNAEVPCLMLDNDFREPDLQRFLEAFDQFDPSIAVLGDAYTPTEAREYQSVVEDLEQEHPYKNYIVVPKSKKAFDILDDPTILGYPLGYSDLDPGDYSSISDWRGRDVHILGASPSKSWDAIQELTQPTLTGEEPVNIRGLDYNGFHRVAYLGEHWGRDGYERADHLSIRETVRRSLEETKKFWQEKGVWPETTPVDIYGKPVDEPDEFIFMDKGGDPIRDRESLEHSYVEDYGDEYGVLAFESEVQKKFIEYREDLV